MDNIFTGEIKNTRFILTLVAVGLFAFFGIFIIILIVVTLFAAPEKAAIPEGLMGLLTTLMGAIIAIVSVAYNSHFKAREDDAAAKADAARFAAATSLVAPVVPEPKNDEEYCSKGIALAEQEKLDESIQAFDEFINQHPEDADARNNKALALGKQGKYNDAVKAYDEAIKLDSKNEAAKQGRDLVLKASKEDEDGKVARDMLRELKFIGSRQDR